MIPRARHGEAHGPRLAAGAAALLLAATPALSRGAPAPDGVWFGGGLLAGSTLLDSRFAEFQWNVAPRPAWGAEVAAGRGPWTTGLRAWRASSTQEIGQPGTTSPDVALTSLEWSAGRRVAGFAGAELLGRASVGRVWIGYHPDRVTITPAGSAPITVDLAPLREWCVGAGLALRRPVAAHWSAGLAVDYQTFGLDVARDSGGGVQTGRETFGDWHARLGLAWVTRHP